MDVKCEKCEKIRKKEKVNVIVCELRENLGTGKTKCSVQKITHMYGHAICEENSS